MTQDEMLAIATCCDPKPAEVGTSVATTRAYDRMRALGRLKIGAMNKTEQAYAQYLDLRRQAGEVLWFRFEGMKLRLADNTFYTPDFAVMAADGQLECHEVKGFWTDDARVKIKVAAEQYPLTFLAVKAKAKKDGGGWAIEIF
ncbi:DUF1064 domain-containing protein [Cupriavidus gilardii]|uniref:DUF1064 domain-containing protein n=1 Tax=Cupriavidus gilardii TaxID=82541 RepID=UPI002B2F21B0|nr:DUF1064 domain-containing protein [Cupriavidus gilardii]